MKDLQFFGTDPGAVKYGNFINYYSFHSASQRIKNLNPKMFPELVSAEPLLCLDIGCNTGELTAELKSYLKALYPTVNIYILAIDIDATLIKRAQESNKDLDITYTALNIMDSNAYEIIEKFLNSYNKTTFDMTFCFSVTMWIHLNNGDEGLVKFLQYIKEISKTIIIEPQPWNCYRNAQRRVKKSGSTFLLYETLKIRGNVLSFIEEVLQQDKHRKKYESPNSSWSRKILSYTLETS